MAHPYSRLVGGYYPLPADSHEALASLFAPCTHEGGLILDPVAGEAEALISLASKLNLKPYANELDHERAQVCRQKLGIQQAIEGDVFNLRTPLEAYSLVYCNPPYDENKGGAEESRRELEILKECWKWAQYGGYLIWVVYSHHMTERAARFLAERSRIVDVYRIPGKHLERYDQIVVVARKRAKPSEPEADLEGRVETLVSGSQVPDTLPELRILDVPRYTLPAPARPKRFYIRPEVIEPDTMLESLSAFGAHHLIGFRTIVTPPPPQHEVEAPVPPRAGQIGLLVAAGVFDGLMLNLESGPAAVRGVARPAEIDITPPGMHGVRETIQHKAQVTITLLHENGQLTTIPESETSRLISFLREHRHAFIDYITRNSRTLYNFDYAPYATVFNRVFRNRKLPGRPVTGLFETQKHVVASAYLTLMKRKSVIIVGEMGTGKTTCGSTIAAILHDRRKIKPGQIVTVMCPPHLTTKWVAEAQDTIPGAHVEIAKHVADVRAFMQKVDARPKQLHVLIVSRERAKLGEGWEPAYLTRKRAKAHWGPHEPVPDQYKNFQTGEPITQRLEIYTEYICSGCGQPIRRTRGKGSEVSLAWLKRQPRFCCNEIADKRSGQKRSCGTALWQFKRTFSKPKAGQTFVDRSPRYPLAFLLAERYRQRLALTLFDELHELKAESSDQARAMQKLARASQYSVGLTGTLFGGVASSVFWLEWAFNQRMPHHYPITPEFGGRKGAVDAWVRTMGVLEKTIEYKNEDGAESHVYSGSTQIEHRPKETPGISPLLIRELLDHCVWVTLQDMAFALPEFEEIPLAVELPPEIQTHYERQKDKLLDYLLERKREGDASFLSSYLQATLRYPTACFREKRVLHHSHLVATMQGFGEARIYPKEQALIRLLRQEIAAGRPCAVFVDQTGKNDILPRLQKLIAQKVPGAKPLIMRAGSPDTEKRMEWLDARIQQGANVLICHPRLVETGVDLLYFKTLVIYEPIYSLYTLAQVSRRHWRIGQTDKCKVVYLFYNGTMEAQAVDLISKKMSAAALLMGDADGGALAQLATGGARSLEAELARTIATSDMVVDVGQLFKEKAETSADFTSGWAHGRIADDETIQVIPLENLIGRFFYREGQLHEIVDYGPLTEETYHIRRVGDGTETQLAAKAVKTALMRSAAHYDSPIQQPGYSPAKVQVAHATPAIRQALALHRAAKARHAHPLVFIRISDRYYTCDHDARALKTLASLIPASVGSQHLVTQLGTSAFANVQRLMEQKKRAILVINTNQRKGNTAAASTAPGRAARASKRTSDPLRDPDLWKPTAPRSSDPKRFIQRPSSPADPHYRRAYAQYQALKARHPEALPFIHNQEFLETFDEDAHIIASIFNLPLLGRTLDDKRLTYAAIPAQAPERYLNRLRQEGHKPLLLKPKTAATPAAKPAPTSEPLPTSLLALHTAMKRKHPQAIPLIQHEDVYYGLAADAARIAKLLKIETGSRQIGEKAYPVVALEAATIQQTVKHLQAAGLRIATLNNANQAPIVPATQPGALHLQEAYEHYGTVKASLPEKVLFVASDDSLHVFGEDARLLSQATNRAALSGIHGPLKGIPHMTFKRTELPTFQELLEMQGHHVAIINTLDPASMTASAPPPQAAGKPARSPAKPEQTRASADKAKRRAKGPGKEQPAALKSQANLQAKAEQLLLFG